MKYIVFAYSQYYPNGGMNDCLGQFDTLIEAMNRAGNGFNDNVEIHKADENGVHPLIGQVGFHWVRMTQDDAEALNFPLP